MRLGVVNAANLDEAIIIQSDVVFAHFNHFIGFLDEIRSNNMSVLVFLNDLVYLIYSILRFLQQGHNQF